MSFVRACNLTRSFNIKVPVCGYILTRRRLGVFTWASFLGEWMIFHGSSTSSSFTADRRLTSALSPPISKMDHWHSTYNLIINLPTHLQTPLSFPFLLHPPRVFIEFNSALFPWFCHQRSGKSKCTQILLVSLSLRLLTKADKLLLPLEGRANHRVPHIHIHLWCMDYGKNKWNMLR